MKRMTLVVKILQVCKNLTGLLKFNHAFLLLALLASPAVAQEVRVEPLEPLKPIYAGQPAQEPSRDAQLLDFYRELVAGKNREISDLLVAIEQRNKTIASQEATIKAWETRASGKMSRGDKWKLGLTLAGSVAAIVGTAVGR